MTPKERVRIALTGGKPDRVPFVPAVDYDYMALAAAREPWEFIHGGPQAQGEIHEGFLQRHPCDVWPCWGAPSPRGQEHREIVREGDRVYYHDHRTGRRYRIDRRGGLLGDDGRTVMLGDAGEEIDPKAAAIWVARDGYPRTVESLADIDEFVGGWDEEGYFANLEYLRPRYGDNHFLCFCTNTLFAEALDLFGGFQEGLIALHTKRDLFHMALEAITERRKQRLVRGAALGADGAWMIEYCAGGDTISRSAYQEFVLPYEQEVAREAHRLGLLVYMWYLGDLMPLLPDLALMEVDGLFPEQGRKGYEVDLGEVRRQVGDRMCLIGFNDEEHMIAGHRRALREGMQRQIDVAGREGAFMMGTTYVIEDTPLEHLDFYIDTLHHIGRYD